MFRITPVNYIVERKSNSLPVNFYVYPVPCKDNLTVAYTLPQRQRVSLSIYDVLGRRVRELIDGYQKPGSYRIFWNGSDDRNRMVSAGVYFLRFETESYSEIKKVIFLR